jgi:hypothetical protein
MIASITDGRVSELRAPLLDPDFVYPPGVLSPARFAVAMLGLRNLYPWQILALEAFGQGLPVVLLAANGSGKTRFVIATLVLWLLTYFPRCQIPLTSGSWTQLEQQLWPAIEAHRSIYPDWDWRSMQLTTPSGGRAFTFSTLEPGRAEGYHGTHDEPCAYFIDEAKTVPDGIYHSSRKCTCQYRLVSSSAGGPKGFFYDLNHKLRSRHWVKRVTYEDCPHLAAKFAQDSEIYEPDDPILRAMHFSEFGSQADYTPIVNPELLKKLFEHPPGKVTNSRTAFGDFAAGGNENVLALRDGNQVSLIRCWRELDTTQTVRQFVAEFQRLRLVPSEIYGDEGGLGHVIIDALAEAGWMINRANNGEAASDPEHYANVAAETWFTAARKIERREVILPNDPVFFRQATTRKAEYDSKQRMRCEAKQNMKESPDRADAVFGALYFESGANSASALRQIGMGQNAFVSGTIDFSAS